MFNIKTILCTCVFACLFAFGSYASVHNGPCDRSRHLFTSTWGVITDGPSGSNYTQDSHCEWLIRAPNKNQFITLSFRYMGTECSFDYVFVYEGDSFKAPLLGSFSGKTEPQQVTSSAGSMLILLYSDTNYVLGGFQAEFSVTDCPRNCSGHGDCVRPCEDEGCIHVCVCHRGYGGGDCSREVCPDRCGLEHSRGMCAAGRCHCNVSYSGMSCSLHPDDLIGNRWHWLSHSGHGLKPRAAHSAVYDPQTDSLYVFGGYDLNNVLGDLSVYRFSTSNWEDEKGTILGKDMEGNGVAADAAVIEAVLRQDVLGVNPKSFLGTLIYQFSENASRTSTPTSSPRKPKHMPPSFQFHDMDKSTLLSPRNGSEPEIGPMPRYGHTAARYPGGFVIHGGKLVSGRLSDELWFYDVRFRKWSLRCPNCANKPPPLTWHTITLVEGAPRNISYLYLFGGSTDSGEFSSRLFRISLVTDKPWLDRWEEVRPRGGKELDLRIVAHTTSYHKATDSLLVYGGVMASYARLSKLSDRMFLFKLENRLWTEVHYPRSDLPDTYVPHERAFHTSSILGSYLLVFGGYSHRHNKEEICYDNQMYFYHLGCHTWVSHEIFGASENGTRYGKQQGVFAQAADVRGGNTLLVVGGYHGNVNADLWAYTLPPTLASRAGEPFEPETVCPRHHSHAECASNPECGWCSVDSVCYGRTVGLNCTTNLQTRRCPGICPALGTCHSCLVHGDMPRPAFDGSVAQKLKLGQCTWCVQNARCHHKDDNYGVCGVSEDAPSQVQGWWGPQGTEVTSVSECRIKDRRPGLTFIKYRHPANFSHPDFVSIINATAADIDVSTKEMRAEAATGASTARLLGFLRTPQTWEISHETLKMCASFSQAVLRLSTFNYTSRDDVVNLTAETKSCSLAKWSDGKIVELDSGRFLVDLQAKGYYINNPTQSSSMMLMHNRSAESASERVFTFEYLEPYEQGACSSYTNCLHCLTDSLCGWCGLTSQCVTRNTTQKPCRANEDDDSDWQYLTLHPHMCTNCSNYVSCQTCVGSQLCEWWADDAKCARRGRADLAVRDVESCPAPCHKRQTCATCLDDKDRCVWCEATQECFSFSVYTSQYQFGLCREWVDLNYHQHPQLMRTRGSEQCKNCSRHANCSTCLHTLSCGWCYSIDNPILGACVPGDFNKPAYMSCDSVMSMRHDKALVVGTGEAGWSYGQCPDVDECDLKLDDCHPNATCTNTHGSYSCQCERGYSGDGHASCEKTCFEECVHGRCSMAPDYECECDLGWTSIDCSLDCGCNNHSTCSQGLQTCDDCQDWTTGQYCQFCKKGSFGNATSPEGCKPCDCNGHGDQSEGLCDPITGICFCQHNTEGLHCETCRKGYYGDPRHSGICYFQCSARGMVVGSESQGIGSGYSNMTPWESRLEGQPVRDCLWILAPRNISESTQGTNQGAVIQLRIPADLNVTCENNAVYVYDALPDVVLSSASHHSHALGTFCRRGDLTPFVVESKTGVMTVMFKQGSDGEGFNATYTIFSCPDQCPGSRSCINGQCVCASGWAGPNCSLPLCPQNCSFVLKQGVCDRGYGRCLCAPGFGEPDCSVPVQNNQLVITELFNSARLSDSFDHLRKMIPRFGHSLVTDRRGSVWMFGGFSPSHGPLNDIRLFDTRNNTWMQVTVDSTRDASMPQGRYLHAAEIVHSRREIYVLGGIADKEGTVGLSNNTLRDFWKFSIPHQGWIDIQTEISPPPVAGHTMTLRKDPESESLVVIGGFSQRSGFMDNIWNFDLHTEKWTMVGNSGSGPNGLYGHTTVYHESSKSLYVFGGYVYRRNGTRGSRASDKLYALHFPTMTWTLLPPFYENSVPPFPRFLHSSVATDHYMLVLGGQLEDKPHSSQFLFAYFFACNQWIQLLGGKHVVGTPPPWTYGQDMALDLESNAVFVVGGFTGAVESHVTRIKMPDDSCNLWDGKEACRGHLGCSYCAVTHIDGSILNSCYSSSSSMPDVCKYHNNTLITNNGVVCDYRWLSNRECGYYSTCAECAVRWPLHWDQDISCQWDHGTCMPHNGTATECSSRCFASDCEKCLERENCAWGQTGCVIDMGFESLCPALCGDFGDCTSCLSTPDCHWSVTLQECISPLHQPLYCAGGACGLVLRGGQGAQCPEPCSTAQQCSTCLRSTHCGWCGSDTPLSGEGICSAGTMLGPVVESCVGNSSWSYVACPLENECLNGHHSCDNISEVCQDVQVGFECVCAPGYAPVESHCEPVCRQGCVRGSCTLPDHCDCDFGYVGSNCSIQCQCNGHSDCEGPDKLDKCIQCQNNTQGAQCDRCKPLFVGDATNNGSCIPCFDYCHGHTHNCAESPDALIITDEGEQQTAEALCLGCMNATTGYRCQTCRSGFFRGALDLRQPCRPCECHGHGNMCDPVTGEKCNCGNNTESECLNTVSKNSNQQCWMLQCSKCKETYFGTPTDGHQCYKQMTLDHKFCLDYKLQDECKMKPSPLYPGQSVFIMVQPRYVNVDIRIMLDVSEGSLDLRMSHKDDFLVVDPLTNITTDQVVWDPNYHIGYGYGYGYSGKGVVDASAVHANKSLNEPLYWVKEQNASNALTTYITLRKKNIFLLVKNIRNRLVLTLPKDRHDLVSTKFYIALTSSSTDSPSYGIIFFRQDQLHIDLFVFFSVFFSCFFLFLAACVVAWKAKQAAELRRARRRHVVEMLHMAKRPFAGLVVDLQCEDGDGRRSSSRQTLVRPIAIEPTEDGVAGVATLFIQLPGGDSAPVRLSLASALILMSRVYPLNSRAFLRRRNSHHV